MRRVRWLAFLERPVYRILGVKGDSEQSWQRYGGSVIVFSGVMLLIGYVLLRLQGHLPLNPGHLPDVTPALAWNTIVSFVTNMNWQSYSGESTMSYLSQMGTLALQNFLSASVGIAVAVALIRGFSRKGSSTIGNFWIDLVRGTRGRGDVLLHAPGARPRTRGALTCPTSSSSTTTPTC
jgi:potassium-transporting ATPase potassium-binding subunit